MFHDMFVYEFQDMFVRTGMFDLRAFNFKEKMKFNFCFREGRILVVPPSGTVRLLCLVIGQGVQG